MTQGATIRWVAAGVLLAVKAVLGALVGIALIQATRSDPEEVLGRTISEPHVALGWFVLLMTVAAIVLAVALLRRYRWGRTGTFALEAVSIVAALTRLPSRPGLALLSIALSVAIVVLVAPPLRAAAPAESQA